MIICSFVYPLNFESLCSMIDEYDFTEYILLLRAHFFCSLRSQLRDFNFMGEFRSDVRSEARLHACFLKITEIHRKLHSLQYIVTFSCEIRLDCLPKYPIF